MRDYLLRGSLLTTFVIATCSVGSVEAQSTGAVRWFVRVVDADVAREGRSFRIYETPYELTVQLTISNESSRPIVVQRPTLLRQVRFTVSSNRQIPVAATLRNEIWQAGNLMSISSLPGESVSIEPGREVECAIDLLRTDGQPFSPDRYSIRVSVDANAWNTRLVLADTELAVITGPPAPNPSEQAAAFRQEARKGLAQNRLDSAIIAYEKSIEAEPSNTVSLIGLGDVYLRGRRYREAVPILERAMALIPSEGSAVALKLARAYIGTNDDKRAAAALRRAGLSEQRVSLELVRLRNIVEQVRRQ
jgi:tetratricopeptide repeat protein